jgi:hypothetical protein
MELWDVQAKEEIRAVRVFINTPTASIITPLGEPGYVETIDIDHFDRLARPWVLKAGPPVRRLVTLGLLKPGDKISVQLVPVYGRSATGSGTVTLDGATLVVDDY